MCSFATSAAKFPLSWYNKYNSIYFVNEMKIQFRLENLYDCVGDDDNENEWESAHKFFNK